MVLCAIRCQAHRSCSIRNLSAESYIERIAKKYLPNDPETYPAVSTPCGPRLNDLYEEAVAKRESVDPELQRTFAQKCGAVIYCLCMARRMRAVSGTAPW